MLKLRTMLAISLLGLSMSALILGSAFAADPKAAGAGFGSVDIQRAFNEYDKKKQLDQELQQFGDQLTQRLDLRNANKLLTPDEFKQLADLKAKPKQTDAEQKKIEELLALSKQREQEFQALQQKQDSTDADKARLKELQEQIDKTDASLKEELARYRSEVAQKTVELSKQVVQDIEAVVASIAKEKGLAMVFAKSVGEYTFVVYSNVDITDEVLKRLNKK